MGGAGADVATMRAKLTVTCAAVWQLQYDMDDMGDAEESINGNNGNDSSVNNSPECGNEEVMLAGDNV